MKLNQSVRLISIILLTTLGLYGLTVIIPSRVQSQSPHPANLVQSSNMPESAQPQQECDEDPLEQDDTQDNANPLTVDGDPQMHNVCPAQDVDWVYFDASGGITYTVETVDLGEEADTVLCLYDDTDTELRCDDDSGIGKSSRITVQPVSDARYWLEVRDYDIEAEGDRASYGIQVLEGFCREDNFEPNNSPDEAKSISTDGSLQTHNICPERDEDWVSFHADAGATYSIQTYVSDQEVNTILELYDATNQRLTYNDDFTPSVESYLIYRFDIAGIYFVRTILFNPTVYGTDTEYELKIQNSDVTPSSTPANTPYTPTATPTTPTATPSGPGDDESGPIINSIDSWLIRNTNLVNVRVKAEDESDIERVVVSYFEGNQSIKTLDMEFNASNQKWEGTFTGDLQSRFFVQVDDKFGNMTTDTNKGLWHLPFEIIPWSSPTPSSTPSITPTSTPTPSITPTSTPSPTPEGDSYEDDDNCNQAYTFPIGTLAQDRTFHQTTDQDWIHFQATAETTYRIEIDIPTGSAADVDMEIYNSCDSLPDDIWNKTFSPGVRQDFTAPVDGPVYLRLYTQGAGGDAQDLRYQLSVRELAAERTGGAVIILAGRYEEGDPLQDNIHNVTNRTFAMFQSQGYTAEDIYYLTTNSSLVGHDALATNNHLRLAIQEWAAERLANGGALTLYIMDHGDVNEIYIDQPNGERVTPAELDDWLTELERKAPDALINVIIEACHSGSFIEEEPRISKEGRVIISSTNSGWDAYASKEGAYFSDQLLTALHGGRNLFSSFWNAKESVNELFPFQLSLIDADGNGVPNEPSDAAVASERGFAYAGTFGESWPPYIVEHQAKLTVSNQQGQIRAEVRDDKKIRNVWAVIYPPSYEPPEDSDGQLVSGDTDATILLQLQDDGFYTASYPGFDEVGVYKVVIHANDSDDLAARPKVLSVDVGFQLYLPMVKR